MFVHVHSETGDLREVLLGSVETFQLHPPINETQRHYYVVDPPRVDVMIEQQAAFVKVFDQRGVKIHWSAPRHDSPVQFNTRDVATVVGDTLVTCLMKEPVRQNEIISLESLLKTVEGPTIQVESGVIEGGDIILDGQVLYVGLSETTNVAGVA